MIPGIFVTGTDTDIGKTMVVAGVMRWMLARQVNAMVMKPVQTGAVVDARGQMTAPDIDFVLQAAGLRVDRQTTDHLSPYLFEPACSPHLAAQLAGRSIKIERILESARWLAARHKMLIVEGAGGLMAPLGEAGTMLDLAEALGTPVLVVGHSGLGTINHVLLSLDALRRRGLPIFGVILNDIRPVDEAQRFVHDDNPRAIAAFGRVSMLARIHWLGTPPDLSLLGEAMRDCDFDRFLRSSEQR